MLSALVPEIAEHSDVGAVPLMRAGKSEAGTFVAALAELFTRGVDVDWGQAYRGYGARIVDLPTYAFQRERHWLDTLTTNALPPAAVPAQPGTPAALAPAAEATEPRAIHALVAAQVAAALGYADAREIDTHHTFTDLGFDSFTAVEFRTRLGAAVGLSLPAGLVFECPTPSEVADFVIERLAGSTEPVDPAVVVGPV